MKKASGAVQINAKLIRAGEPFKFNNNIRIFSRPAKICSDPTHPQGQWQTR